MEDVDIMGTEDSNPIIQLDHQLMTELSDVPPAQLLDGGSEDMDVVSCHGDG